MSYRHNRAEGHTYKPGDQTDGTRTFSPAYLYNLVMGMPRTLHEAPDPTVC